MRLRSRLTLSWRDTSTSDRKSRSLKKGFIDSWIAYRKTNTKNRLNSHIEPPIIPLSVRELFITYKDMASGSIKRKRVGEQKFYAVQSGFQPGVYTEWNDCLAQVRGFKGAKFKSFGSVADAQLFVTGHDPSLDPNSSGFQQKFYGVHRGKVPGVYTDWASAEAQVKGVQKPKVRSVLHISIIALLCS
ncbi:Caulimovirus viroplasmin-domain-containing protein [Pyronema omphalodes]|nr:Caulimovirus viroplasmin-domain-containing protein [Pyronema omphalodes]